MLDRLFATMRELGRIVHALKKTALAELDDIEVQAARNYARKGRDKRLRSRWDRVRAKAERESRSWPDSPHISRACQWAFIARQARRPRRLSPPGPLPYGHDAC